MEKNRYKKIIRKDGLDDARPITRSYTQLVLTAVDGGAWSGVEWVASGVRVAFG